jgi:transposase
MSLKVLPIPPVPEETARVVRACFPHGTLVVQVRDALGTLYSDEDFADLFPTHGQPAEAPWRLALVTVLQFVEGLPDRQAADAVRSRLDWKYALSLELTDPGFDHTVLSEFRTRLVAGRAEERLLDLVLEQGRARGWLKVRGKQRTDSTHVLAAVRALTRLECVGETLRHALNVLAEVEPQWLRAHAPVEWVERYAHRVEEYRLPSGKAEREQYANQVGADGWQLLDALDAPATPAWLRELPAVQTLRQVWAQQYHPREPRVTRRPSSASSSQNHGPGAATDEEQDSGSSGESNGHWRAKAELAPSNQLQNSPYDPDARYGKKRETSWVGYKVHVTETCDSAAPHLIVHVATTPACVADAAALAPIHEHLADRHLLPERQLVDAGYIDAEVLSASQARFGVDVLGPARGNFRWQARARTGFEGHHFAVDWQGKQVICPQGHASRSWTPMQDRRHVHTRDMISVAFSVHDCRPCPSRSQCTRSAYRTLTLHPREQEQALRAARIRERTDDFKRAYASRAGVEGTHSQAVRVCGLRRSRYIGRPKTHLQHILSAVAINLIRIEAWLNGTPLAPTRQSSFERLMAQAA